MATSAAPVGVGGGVDDDGSEYPAAGTAGSRRRGTVVRVVGVIAAVTAVAGVVAWPSPPPAVMATPYGIGSNSGVFPGPRLTEPEVAWTADVGESYDEPMALAPTVVGSLAIVSAAGGLHGVEIGSGRVRWRLRVETFSRPVVAHPPDTDRLSVLTDDRYLIVGTDGELRSEADASIGRGATAAATDGTVIVVARNLNGVGTVTGAVAADGSPRWELRYDAPELGFPSGTRPATIEIDGGVAVVGWRDQYDNVRAGVTAQSIGTGELLWVQREAGLLGRAGDGAVIVRPTGESNSGDGNTFEVAAVDAVTGRAAWSTRLIGLTDVRSGAATSDGLVALSDGESVIAVDPSSGMVPWSRETGPGSRVVAARSAASGSRSVLATVPDGEQLMATVLDGERGDPRYRMPVGPYDERLPTEWQATGAVSTDTAALWAVGGDIVASTLDGPGQLWRFDTSPSLACAVTPVGDDVVVSSPAGLRRIDADGGSTVWAAPVGSRFGHFGPSPVTAVGQRLVHTERRHDGHDDTTDLVASDADSGDRLWMRSVGVRNGHTTDPVVAGGAVIVGSIDFENRLHATTVSAFRLDDGEPLWTTAFEGQEIYEVHTDGRLVFVPTQRGLTALDATDGTRRWTTDHPTDRIVVPADTDAPLLALNSVGVAALDRVDGRRLWTASVGEPTGVPLAHDGTVIANTTGFLLGLSAADGTELWRIPADSDGLGRPSVVGGLLHVATTTGLQTIDTSNGHTVGSARTDRAITSPLVAASDTLIACTAGDQVTALR